MGLDIDNLITSCAKGLDDIDLQEIIRLTSQDLPGDADQETTYKTAIYVCASHIERDPNYSKLASRILLAKINEEVEDSFDTFRAYVRFGSSNNLLDQKLNTKFDLGKLSDLLKYNRDDLFQYLGLQVIYDRYLLRHEGKIIEKPQWFWMRVAMGLSLNEFNPTLIAETIYEQISQMNYLPSTPTLFNSGTTHPQLASCHLTTVDDSIEGIFDGLKENAQLQKYAGGVANSWSRIRSTGSEIRGTNGKSSGVIPYLKIANDTCIAVDQSSRRPGAVCAYLETWHLDIEEFLELRKNTGDERRRFYDMNTANWIPDLFMDRVRNDDMWTLFSPDDVKDLHELYGAKFNNQYKQYEYAAEKGLIKNFRKVSAKSLWRKMLSMLFETGHPWITFKDPSNIRYMGREWDIVHSSNLCVAPETKILTDQGWETISELEDMFVNVWNGKQFSKTQVKKTSDRSKLIKINFSGGIILECTEYHKFYIQQGLHYIIVPAKELKPGDIIQGFMLPNSSAHQFIKVLSIDDNGREDCTYCFNEPIEHKGLFNGVLTGNCTEITLPTSSTESAVCTLASINLSNHILNGGIDWKKLNETVQVAVRGLDNSIDISFYPTEKSKFHRDYRPLGLGMMGWQDLLFKMKVPFDSEKAIELADHITEFISYVAIHSSMTLAMERGAYKNFRGSAWDAGKLPIDTIDWLNTSREVPVNQDRSINIASGEAGWEALRREIRKYGIRNSCLMAIAPTATISLISNTYPCIEPAFKNLYVKSNASGDFTVLNQYLVEDLKELGLWGKKLGKKLKQANGSVQNIAEIPQTLRDLYKTAFEISPKVIVDQTSRRQKWIDQSQSMNLFLANPSGKELNDIYMYSWEKGCKGTYYLRSKGASDQGKMTVSDDEVPKVCSIEDIEMGCESCQ